MILLLTTGGCISLQSTDSNALHILCVGDDATCDRVQEFIPLYEKDAGIPVILKHVSKEEIISDSKKGGHETESYDLIIMNHSIMTFLAEGRYIERLDPYMDASSYLNRSLFEWPPLIQYGEYPTGSGEIYSLPFDPDVLGIVYRGDIFADQKEQADFVKQFGYELKKPLTYTNLSDIASFFSRPEKGMYGIGLPGTEESVQALADSVFLSNGGSLYDPISHTTKGILNSQTNRDSLMMLQDLYSRTPPSSSTRTDDDLISSVAQGEVPMAIMPFSSFEKLINSNLTIPLTNLSFATLPGQNRDGTFRRVGSLMGESIGIGANSDKKEIAWDFLTWYYNPETQLSWSLAGGQPGRASVQDMPAYFLAKPYNFCFPTSLRIAIDPWRLSNADAVTDIYRLYLNHAVFNRMSPDEALQNAAEKIDPYLKPVQ